MPDSKITALTSIGASTDPANDPLVLVDVSDTSMAASGTTKKVTLNQLLGASGTATLASATITGDLTVASSILKVSGGNVGINTASPTNTAGYKTLEIVGTGVNTGGMIRMKSSDASVSSYDFVDNNGRGIFAVSNHNLRFGCNDIEQYRIQPLGIFTWYDGAGGTRMTLNSTGLGVGASPSERITVNSSTAANYIKLTNSGANTGFLIGCFNTAVDIRNKEAGAMNFFTSDTQRMQIDSSGNVGVGVTPRAWATGYRALNLGIYTGLTDNQGGATYLTNNAYYDTVDSRWEAVTNNRALRYDQDTADGGHKWYSAPSVAANAALVWSNPMILDASGNLIWSPASSPPSLATNGQLTVNATSNTNLRFSYRGSDGVTRVANITLA